MRLVALGASNLTRGLHALVGLARQAWGDDASVVAALGHGRSYGQQSRFVARSLPGILECGLWDALARGGPGKARALVTDVGNDILYGVAPDRLLEWVEACVERLQAVTDEVTITDLPLDAIRRLGPARYLFFRTLFVPSCRLPLAETRRRAEEVSERLVALAARRGLRLVRLRPEWYGVDPIHIRPSLWAEAWGEIAGLAGDATARAGDTTRPGTLRLYLARPERMGWLGLEVRRRQPCLPGLELY